MKENLVEEIELPRDVTARLEEKTVKIKGAKGEVERNFSHPEIMILLKDNKIILSAKHSTKKVKKILYSLAAHLKNMIKGVQTPYVYKLSICSGHFPMNVSVSGEEVVVKNFLGETVPRKIKLLKDAVVKVSGSEIEVSSPDKEVAGQMAARIENLCRVTKRDLRIFQDGCYIIHKAGKDI